ncbi:DedA family protein [Micrococcales bacterium 31B]|nr:DedA family protein [Micrococcales bacterium 31B]
MTAHPAGLPADNDPATAGDAATTGDAAHAGDAATGPDGASATKEPEWWEADGLPFRGKPSKAELWCYGAFAFTGLFSLAMLPVRPALAAADVNLWASIMGTRTSVITLGAFHAVQGEPLWWLTILAATLTVMKFDIIYWWAGKLWGPAIFDMIVGKTKFSQKNADRAVKIASKYGGLAILLTYFVPLIPVVVVYAVTGMSGMKWQKFLIYNFIGSLASRLLYFYLGYTIGQPIVDVFEAVDKYLLWVSLGLIVVVVYLAYRRGAKANAARAGT